MNSKLNKQNDTHALAFIQSNEPLPDVAPIQYASITEYDEGSLHVYSLFKDNKEIATFHTKQGAIDAANKAGWKII